MKSKVSSLNTSSKISALTNFTFSILFFFEKSFPKLIDASVGYRFSPNVRLDVSATNLTDVAYKTFPNLPTIRRRVLGKLTWNF